jgi:Stage II sporulation protein E (SpoIIE)
MAAMAVSLIVGAVRALAEDHSDPAELLTLLNRRLCGRLHGGFATCLILRIDPKSGCRLASAGHPAPYKNDREVDVPGALPLGMSPTVTYDATEHRPRSGRSLLLVYGWTPRSSESGGRIV